MQPFVVSPRACTWKPCNPGLSPEIFPVTVVDPKELSEKNEFIGEYRKSKFITHSQKLDRFNYHLLQQSR